MNSLTGIGTYIHAHLDFVTLKLVRLPGKVFSRFADPSRTV